MRIEKYIGKVFIKAVLIFPLNSNLGKYKTGHLNDLNHVDIFQLYITVLSVVNVLIGTVLVKKKMHYVSRLILVDF